MPYDKRLLKPLMNTTWCAIVALGISLPAIAQSQEVTYEVTALSDTLTLLRARGGNVVVSAGEDGGIPGR